MPRIGEGLARVRAGTDTFDAFVRENGAELLKMAKYVHRRWGMPQWCDERDLCQEIAIGCWEFVWRWEPHRGVTLERYVTFNAIDRAKKKAHKARGANLHGSAGRNPSQFDLPSSALHRDRQEGERSAEWFDEFACSLAEQEQAVERGESFARAARDLLECERRILAHLRAAGSLAKAAEQVWADPEARKGARIASRRQAARAVVRVAAKVAEDFAPEELREWMEAS
jgi:hypothetical protein